jgi:hypothetical protein
VDPAELVKSGWEELWLDYGDTSLCCMARKDLD